MDKYELLTKIVPEINIIQDKKMPSKLHGLYYEDSIYINGKLSHKEKVATLSEEIGHYVTSAGDITDYSKIQNAKQEFKARRFGYELVISLDGIVNAYKENIKSLHEMSSYFEVKEDFIIKAIQHYKMKYGLSTLHGDYLIRFEPLEVYEYKKI